MLGFAVTVANWQREVVACRHFILGSVATFWVMSLVGIYPGRASNAARRMLTSVYFSRNTSPVGTHVYSVSSLNSNTKLTNKNGESGIENLETVRIPTFSGSKTEFQKSNTTFTSCVDAIATALSAQFKMEA